MAHTTFLYSDYFDLQVAYLGLLADMPIKFRNVLLPSVHWQLEASFLLLRDLKLACLSGAAANGLGSDTHDFSSLQEECVRTAVAMQAAVELGAKLKAVSPGRAAIFLNQSAEFVNKFRAIQEADKQQSRANDIV